MKERVAVVFGTFAPLHQGHIDLIQRAKRQCDRVCVIVSGYKGDRGEEVGLPLQKRFRYIREGFSNDELTQIYKLDETELPRYPLGWEPWLKTALETTTRKNSNIWGAFKKCPSRSWQTWLRRDYETPLERPICRSHSDTMALFACFI